MEPRDHPMLAQPGEAASETANHGPSKHVNASFLAVIYAAVMSLQAKVHERMGWTMGLEPTTTGITIRDSTN